MKATLSEIKLHRKPNSEGKEAGVQINDLEHKEEINSQSKQNKETISKNEERIRRLWDISKCTNIQIIGMPEREEREQELKTYLNK